MKKLLIIILFLPMYCIGQKQGNIWYFGDHAGVDFNSGKPVALIDGATYNQMNYSEGTSVISDSSGHLLFYSNGQKVWNKNNQVMPNGDSLIGNYSSTQSSVIVPLPGSSRFFYLFTVDDYWEDKLKHGFGYSVIDICMDNGLGDVTNKKNISLLDTVDEKVGAVRHSNGQDYWIIIHKLYTDKFYSYLLTANGITDTVITHIGATDTYAQGQLKISSTGNKIAMASDQSFALPCYFELLDFDNSTGILSNLKSLTTPQSTDIYGVEFSPDNTKLYASYGSVSPTQMGIAEYNLNAGGGNQDSISHSMVIVYKEIGAVTLKGLQLGPDGKIYQGGILDSWYLMAINHPDNYGSSCNIKDSAVYLGGKQSSEGLPTFIAGYNYSNTISKCEETAIQEQNNAYEISVYPNPTTRNFTISFPISTKEITITNTLGQTLQTRTVETPCMASLQSNFEIKENGVYFVQIKTGDRVITKKVIVCK